MSGYVSTRHMHIRFLETTAIHSHLMLMRTVDWWNGYGAFIAFRLITPKTCEKHMFHYWYNGVVRSASSSNECQPFADDTSIDTNATSPLCNASLESYATWKTTRVWRVWLCVCVCLISISWTYRIVNRIHHMSGVWAEEMQSRSDSVAEVLNYIFEP